MPYITQKSIPNAFLALSMVIGALAIHTLPAVASEHGSDVDSSKWNNIKIATITEMYAENASDQYAQMPTLRKYADQDLQKAMRLEEDYFDKHEMICGTGHDVMWDSQDPDYAQDKQISINTEGLVQVNLAQGSEVYYKLTCDDDNCQVADVIMTDNESLKDFLNSNCH